MTSSVPRSSQDAGKTAANMLNAVRSEQMKNVVIRARGRRSPDWPAI